MKTTNDYLDQLAQLSRDQGGTGSDYAIARMLSCSDSRVSNWRNGRGTFDNEMCCRVEQVLGTPPGEVLLNINAEREPSPAARSVWEKLATAAGNTAAAVAFAVVLLPALLTYPGTVAGAEKASAANAVYSDAYSGHEYTLCVYIGIAGSIHGCHAFQPFEARTNTMSAHLLRGCGLSARQVQLLLQISTRTYYRWLAQNNVPHLADLVLRSIAHGLPVSAITSHQWDGWRFWPDGAFISPGGFPFWPSDLWIYELLVRNGVLPDHERLVGAEVPHERTRVNG